MKEAWSLTNGDRRDAYGDPREVFDAYGAIWTSILGPKLKPGCTIDAADATLMMAGLKLCREAHKIKRDNVVDCHGYLSLHSRVTGLLDTTEAQEDPERTLKSLAVMLGWENVPPRHILEAEIRALKARAVTAPEPVGF